MGEFEDRFVDKLVQGDCLEVMKRFPDDCVDLLVTDPPYGISFMGKEWDKAVPSVDIWKECLRVLKPGGFAFVMSSPRLDVLSQMAMRLGEAGFEICFTPIYWCYGTGMPKGLNISKAVDKKMGHGKGKAIGTNENVKGRSSDRCKGKVGGFGLSDDDNAYEPSSEEAKNLKGAFAGYQPKPAVEVIIVAMKPLAEKTYVEQALKTGKGVTWLDDCRIPFVSEEDRSRWEVYYKERGFGASEVCYGDGKYDKKYERPDEKGRYAANLLVSDDSLNDGKERKTGDIDHVLEHENMYSGGWKACHSVHSGDEGSFSRYFDLDRWWVSKVSGLPEEVRKVFPFLIVPKPSPEEKTKGVVERNISNEDEYDGKFPESKADKGASMVHATIKPIKLMSYLITLGSRERDVVLDPFVGSGTTAIAARLIGRCYVGIELDEMHYRLACERLKPYMNARLWDYMEEY